MGHSSLSDNNSAESRRKKGARWQGIAEAIYSVWKRKHPGARPRRPISVRSRKYGSGAPIRIDAPASGQFSQTFLSRGGREAQEAMGKYGAVEFLPADMPLMQIARD